MIVRILSATVVIVRSKFELYGNDMRMTKVRQTQAMISIACDSHVNKLSYLETQTIHDEHDSK